MKYANRGDRVRIKVYDEPTLNQHQRSHVLVFIHKSFQGCEGKVIEPYRPPTMNRGSYHPVLKLDDGRKVSIPNWGFDVIDSPAMKRERGFQRMLEGEMESHGLSEEAKERIRALESKGVDGRKSGV